MVDKIHQVLEHFQRLSLAEKVDQIFVTLKQLIMACVPDSLHSLVSVVLSIALIMMVFPGVFAIITVV